MFCLICSPSYSLLIRFSFFKIAAEIAAPLSQAKKITMVTDGSGDVGAAKLTNEVLMIMSSVPTTVKNMTGVDITQQLSRSGLTGSRVININHHNYLV